MYQFVTGFTAQKDKSGLKIMGPCKCGSCTAFTARKTCAENESLVDYVSCCGGLCTSQPLCLPPSKKDCDIGKSSKGEDPLVSVSKISANHVKCNYNLTKIDTLNQTLNYFDKFGKSDVISENYCMKPTKNNLSRASDTNDNKWCSVWLGKTDPITKTLAVNNYCKQYKESSDCRCINRASDPIYQKLKGSKNFSDACWYVPCAGDPTQLKTSDLEQPVCPTSYCQSIVQVMQARDVSVKDVSGKINCNFKDLPLKKKKSVPKVIIKKSTIHSLNPNNSKHTVILGLLLIVLMIMYIMTK